MVLATRPERRRAAFLERAVHRIRRDRILLVLAVPGILLILLFRYVPLLGNSIAFQDFQPFLGVFDSPWVGFDNFAILSDPAFLNALGNTVIITLIQVVLVFPAPIVVASWLCNLLK